MMKVLLILLGLLLLLVPSSRLIHAIDNHYEAGEENRKDVNRRESKRKHPIQLPNVHLTSSTWIITATVPHMDTQQEAKRPYQHWTCYHPSNATVPQLDSAKDKLFCCQKILDQIMDNAVGYGNLCYEQDKCTHQHKHRTAFLHICNKLIAVVPKSVFINNSNKQQHEQENNGGDHEKEEEEEEVDIQFHPQLTLVLGPDTERLRLEIDEDDVKDEYKKTWRQYMWVSTTAVDDKTLRKGHFHATPPTSPLDIALDPKTFPYGPTSSSEAENKKKKNFFQAGLQTSVGMGSSQAERLLQHTLTLVLDNIHNTTTTTSSIESWKATLQVLIFAPIDLSLRTKNLLSSCSSDKPSITASCQVVPTNVNQKSNPAVPEVHSLTVTVAADGDDAKEASNSNVVKVKWTTRVLLDDEDEDLIVPAPVILDGRLQVTRTTSAEASEDKDDSKSSRHRVYEYSSRESSSFFQLPLSTIVEEGAPSWRIDEL